MEFKSLKKIHDGHFIHRYDITYETVDGKEKVYEMISRNPDISTLSELQAKTPDSVVLIMHDEKNEKIYRSAVEQTQAEMPGQDGRFYRGTLKRKQVLESETSIVIIGDVEEGATVVSKGNIVIIGTLFGCAQAGASGRKDAFIAALHMEPEKLRIGDRKVKPVIGGNYSWARLS